MSGGVVLVVGDDPYIRELVQMVLEVGFGVHAALAAADRSALQQAEELRPSLLVLDVAPREPEGLEIIGELKSNPATRGIPVLALIYERESRTRALGAGCDNCLEKPFEVDALVDVVRRYLRRTENPGPA